MLDSDATSISPSARGLRSSRCSEGSTSRLVEAEGIAIVGASGSGKSTLAPPARGTGEAGCREYRLRRQRHLCHERPRDRPVQE
ncbi:MAG: hypothetical protein MZU95_14090 [Desulfomicrobium escambiense]|nr:hypothetical protein [Desulfomicrobium escambiense]